MGSSISGMGGQKKAYGMKQIPVRGLLFRKRKERNAPSENPDKKNPAPGKARDFVSVRRNGCYLA